MLTLNLHFRKLWKK